MRILKAANADAKSAPAFLYAKKQKDRIYMQSFYIMVGVTGLK